MNDLRVTVWTEYGTNMSVDRFELNFKATQLLVEILQKMPGATKEDAIIKSLVLLNNCLNLSKAGLQIQGTDPARPEIKIGVGLGL